MIDTFPYARQLIDNAKKVNLKSLIDVPGMVAGKDSPHLAPHGTISFRFQAGKQVSGG
jgi:hypothetical protein